MTGANRRLRVAVVQVALEVGELERNLRHVEDVARHAAYEHSPDLIVLPESLMSPPTYGPVMDRLVQQLRSAPYDLLCRLAREYQCCVTGGFLAARGGHPRSTYVIAEPNGATHLHDKDQPDFWENGFAVGGIDDGFASTPLGPVGMACGMEWLRSRTARRLVGSVRLLLGGSCWWSYPSRGITRGRLTRRDHSHNLTLAREAPARLARLVGAPAAVAHQVGRGRPSSLTSIWTTYAGESQVVERDGRVLVRLSGREGDDFAAADVELGDPTPLDPTPETYWLSVLPASLHAAWLALGAQGRWRYRQRYRAAAFPWLDWDSRDSFAYNPPALPRDQRPERLITAEPPTPTADRHAHSI